MTIKIKVRLLKLNWILPFKKKKKKTITAVIYKYK